MLTSDTFAALSAVLTYFFLVGGMGLALLTWRLRRRFSLWRAMGTQGRSDTILNIGLCGVLMIAGYHRGVATYHFALNHWSTAATTAIVYLPLHVTFMAAVLWWLCIELIGINGGGRAWLFLMATGIALGTSIELAF